MRIKRLEIHGFKSFADRAVLNFGKGVTGVVGPNGCGKSNVIDAIRWCMGEMSAKHLRGRAMQDVIFAGSEHRGPLGMAEVTLTFLNDGTAPAQYSDYAEIAVTRRLHRDGTSEYLINRLNVRLRDVVDLFLGTGVGTRAYSIIEQGRVGFIVSSKPEQRRTLIEEVAGVTKFKARKKAAERRMKSTEQNLLRVNDIIGELERQLASLKRQAQKAERYKRLRNELRDLDLHVASMRILELLVENKIKQAQLEKLQQETQGQDVAMAALEARIEAEKALILEEEERLQLQQQKSSSVETKLAALERDLNHWQQQLSGTTTRIEEAASDSQEAWVTLREVREEIVRVREDIAAISSSSMNDEVLIAEAEEKVAAAQRNVSEVDQALDSFRKAALEEVHGSAQKRTHLAGLEKNRKDIATRLKLIREEHLGLHTQELEAKERCAQLSVRRAELEEELVGWKERQVVLEQQFDGLAASLEETSAQLFGLRGELSERKARLDSLVAIADRMEGFPEGIRVLLGKGSDETMALAPNEVVSGILTTVAEVLSTDEKYERALEASLGPALQYLIVRNRDVGLAALDFLREHEVGRGGFVPAAGRCYGSARIAPSIAGTLGRACDLVAVDSQYESVAQLLLESVYFVESLDVGIQLLESGALAETEDCLLVTLGGDCLTGAGIVNGGAGMDKGVFAKQREIRELKKQILTLNERIEGLVGREDELSHQKLQVELEQKELDRKIRKSELDLVELTKDLEAAERDVVRAGDRVEVLNYEITQRTEELDTIQHESTHALVAAEDAEANREVIETQIAEGTRRRVALGEELEVCTEGLTVLKVRISGREQQLRSMTTALERSDFTEVELTQRIERNDKVSEEGNQWVVELREKLADGRSTSEDLVLEAQQLRESVSQARADYETKRTLISERERELRAKRDGGKTKHGQLNECRLALQRMEMDRTRVLDQIEERYDLNLLSVMGDYHHRGLPGDEEAQKKVDLERKIKGMGSINLTAIEECAEVEGRSVFLSEQRVDLQEALDSLRRAINRINRVSRERFETAFHSVNEMFVKVFPRLFRGGEARLELVDSDDMLEAGVDIVAMPPGKKLQNVGLLSGGEKALTATALIFSIFLIKPSPFCVLDEVDAPLDEANVGRFNEMLREISKVSQFIVITHNKITMTSTDRLYGITMEDPGMSKIVSVNLQASSRGVAA